jgi:probable lipoprotein NlpC
MNLSPAGRAAVLSFSVLLFSCTSIMGPRLGPAASRPKETSEVQRLLAEGARSLLGRRRLVVRGRTFPYDCTGLVLAIYWYAGIDLARDFEQYSGNGVQRLYRSLEKENLLYSSPHPATGDIIFWDNTYDRNGDGVWNDSLTHVGMVLASRPDGNIQYVHLNYSRGIVIENMNLLEPNLSKKLTRGQLRILNSPIRLREPGRPHPPLWLAGQLYRVLGMGYLF